MLKIIITSFFCLMISLILGVSDHASLKKVSSITAAEGIEFIKKFPEYIDTAGYGERPQSLNDSHLLALNDLIDWNDPISFNIINPKDLYIAKLANAYIAPNFLGTIFDDKQQLLFEIMGSPGSPLFWPIDSSVANYNIHNYKKIATVQGPTYFYHWVIDRLPSILLLRDILVRDPEIKLVINNQGRVSQYVHEYLDLLGIPKDQRIIAQPSSLYHAESVYFATPFLMEPIPRKLLLELRKVLLEAAQKKSQMCTLKHNLIVVIQRKESDRQIININELISVLKTIFADSDYQLMVYDASMSIADQIQIFNHTRLAIGVTASGLTNIIYMNPGATVIEIHPQINASRGGGEWCWWLSSAVGLNYKVVLTPFSLSDRFVECTIEDIKNILKKIKL